MYHVTIILSIDYGRIAAIFKLVLFWSVHLDGYFEVTIYTDYIFKKKSIKEFLTAFLNNEVA